MVMLPDGRVRRVLSAEFVAMYSLPWSVGYGLPAMPTMEDYTTMKTFVGNTLDGVLARITLGAAARFIQPLIDERAEEEDDGRRAALCFARLWARMCMPAHVALSVCGAEARRTGRRRRTVRRARQARACQTN